MAATGNNSQKNESHTNGNEDNQPRKTSLYSKLVNIGLNDDDIGNAISHIKFEQNPNVIFEGYLHKESAHIKKVRKRWMVLKGKRMYSYKDMQVYEDPTEVFELKEFRTCKMVKNSKIPGQFELISLKQERRTFIAGNKQEMNTWIRNIKKVILFSKDFDFSHKCRNVRSCLSLRRLGNVLRLYTHYNGYNDSYLRYIGSYQQFISDYHHVLDYHLNEYSNTSNNCANANKSCELIQKTLNIHCNINECKCYRRNNRIHEEDAIIERDEKHNSYAHEMNVFRDLLDTIHCALLHSFDTGLKIKHKQLQSMLKRSNELKEKNSCIDFELKELKQHSLFSKKRLQQVRAQNNRFEKNKYFCHTLHEKPLCPLMLNTEEKSEKYSNNRCEFGRKYVYWQDCVSSPYYVRRKYGNFKLEIMDNTHYPLEINKFIETHIKANILLSQSDIIKQIQSDGNNKFGIEANALLCLENIMALIFYCDFDILTALYVSTYYRMDSENDHELIQRHREFCIWSKLLNETVQCFGNTVNDSKIEKYYVCVREQYFDRFMIHFNRPTSMSTQLHIASMYCPQNGIVLEMKKTNCYIGELLRYFDTSLISSFSNENENLFIGGCQSLQLMSVRCMSTNELCQEFIAPFIYFQRIMNGKDILQIWLIDSDYLIISNMISSKIINNACEYPQYVIQCFEKYCVEQTVLRINLKCLYNFESNFIHLNCPNLLLFDNLSILFKNCEVIYCNATGMINVLYLTSLLAILQHINTNKNIQQQKQKKLCKIVLNDVVDIKLKDSEFLYYVNLIHDKVEWILEQTEETVLTLIKCV